MEKPAAVLGEFLRVAAPFGRIILGDFTDKAFGIMDAIYQSEGRKHEAAGWSVTEAGDYYRQNGCEVNEVADGFQRVLLIKKGA